MTSPPTISGAKASARPRNRASAASASARRETSRASQSSMLRLEDRPSLHIYPRRYTDRMIRGNPYEQNLDRNPANHAPLTPLSFIERAAYVYPDRIALIDGERRFTWKETYARSRRLASALAKRGIGRGDTVAVMLPNIKPMYEAHF